MDTTLPPVVLTLPSASLFTSMLPLSGEPPFLPPPAPASTQNAPPFYISDDLYRAALDYKVPITIAVLYAVTAKLLNSYNTSNGKKPWRISKTRLFHVFVVAHNIFLAVYSAWTFWGMLGTLRRSVVNPMGPEGFNGFVDSMTRLHGPAGLGNAVFYNEAASVWESYSNNVSLARDGTPSRTDLGRIWNEGLAFYGWIFYLSKFYEVLDTFIILAKGKLSSTLQTYHHAGAMMCMWAGMRYMSPPIWMFAFVNSGIHAMMYTYYTLSAFNIRVPVPVKRALTSLQITQFLIGASYAMIHSFVSYTVPVTTTYTQTKMTAVSSAASVAAETAEATPIAALLDTLKSLIFGDASKVADAAASANSSMSAPAVEKVAQVTYGQKLVPCIENTGQTFAIWLNVLYLAPLTYLFVKFFITSYLRRSEAESVRAKSKGRRESQVSVAEKAGWDAAKEMQNEVYGTPADKAVINGNAKASGHSLTNGHAANGRVLRSVTNRSD